MENLVKEIIDKDPLAGDIIRVLVLFNGVLWEQEIKWEIEAMNATLSVTQDVKDLSKKISYLADKGLLSFEERLRGSITGQNEKDNLVKLSNYVLISGILNKDEKLSEYIRIRYEIYKKIKK